MVGQRAGYSPDASKGVDATDVHGAGSTDALSARPPQGEGWVHFVLDLKKGIQHHGPTTEIQKKKHEYFNLEYSSINFYSDLYK